MDVSELHTWWQIPSIAHFFSLFNETFGLVDFDIEELEQWLLESEAESGSPFLIDLLCKVMKGCYNNKRKITYANFEFHFRDLIKKRWEICEGKVNPFYENDMNFKKLPVRTKVEMIQSLCDYRLSADDVTDKLKYFETDDLRKVPVGRDSTGALYWYFYGTRLYREVPDVKYEQTPTPGKEVKKQGRRGRRTKEEMLQMEKQGSSPSKRSKKCNDSPPRRRGRKPKRLEEIQSQGTESDSSPASSPARRRGRPMRRGRPPQLRLEAITQSDGDSAVTSSTTIVECRSPPKLTPQVSADSRQTSDTESLSAAAIATTPNTEPIETERTESVTKVVRPEDKSTESPPLCKSNVPSGKPHSLTNVPAVNQLKVAVSENNKTSALGQQKNVAIAKTVSSSESKVVVRSKSKIVSSSDIIADVSSSSKTVARQDGETSNQMDTLAFSPIQVLPCKESQTVIKKDGESDTKAGVHCSESSTVTKANITSAHESPVLTSFETLRKKSESKAGVSSDAGTSITNMPKARTEYHSRAPKAGKSVAGKDDSNLPPVLPCDQSQSSKYKAVKSLASSEPYTGASKPANVIGRCVTGDEDEESTNTECKPEKQAESQINSSGVDKDSADNETDIKGTKTSQDIHVVQGTGCKNTEKLTNVPNIMYKTDVAEKHGNVHGTAVCVDTDEQSSVAMETNKQYGVTMDTDQQSNIISSTAKSSVTCTTSDLVHRLKNDEEDQMFKDSCVDVVQATKQDVSVAPLIASQSEKNVRSKKKSLKSVEAIVSKLKIENIANSANVESVNKQERSPKLKSDPSVALSEKIGEKKMPQTKMNIQDKTSLIVPEKVKVGAICDQTAGEQTDISSTGNSSSGGSNATNKDTKLSEPDQSKVSETDIKGASGVVCMESSGIEEKSKQSSLPPTLIPAHTDTLLKDKARISSKSPSLDRVASQPKRHEQSSPPLLTPAVGEKVAASSYSIDEPLDLSKKPAKSRSASPAVAAVCNGMVEGQGSAGTPLNLCKPPRNSADETRPACGGQLDGTWDSLSSESELEDNCSMCNRENKVVRQESHVNDSFTRFMSCVNKVGLSVYEQLDGVNDPVDGTNTSDPGGGLNGMHSSMNSETPASTTHNNASQTVQPSTIVIEILPDDKQYVGQCEATSGTIPVRDCDTVSIHDVLDVRSGTENKSSENCTSNKQVAHSSISGISESVGLVESAESVDSWTISHHQDEAVSHRNNPEASKASDTKSGDDSLESSGPGNAHDECDEVADVCLFDMECDDVDGNSGENVTRNKILTYTVPRKSGRMRDKPSVKYVDLTFESESEDTAPDIAHKNVISNADTVSEKVVEKPIVPEIPTSTPVVSVVSTDCGKQQPSRVEKEYLKLPKPVQPNFWSLKVEKEYLKAPDPVQPVAVATSSKPKSFTDSFSEFLKQQGANKPKEYSKDFKNSSNDGSKMVSNRVKVKVEPECRVSGVHKQGAPRRSSHSSQGGWSHSKKAESSEEELTEELDSQAEDDELSETELPQTTDGDYLPPVMAKLGDIDTQNVRRSSRRASKKVDYTIDLDPSSPSSSEELSRPASRLSEVLSDETEESEARRVKGEGLNQKQKDHLSDIGKCDVKPSEFQVDDDREAAYNSDTEPENDVLDDITQVERLSSRTKGNQRRPSKKVYESDGSSDYIISDFDDSEEDARLPCKRGRRGQGDKKRGRGRGLKQTIDYICSQLDGQNDSSSSDTDLDAPLKKMDSSKGKTQNKKREGAGVELGKGASVEGESSDTEKSEDEKPSTPVLRGRRTRSGSLRNTVETTASEPAENNQKNNASTIKKTPPKKTKKMDKTESGFERIDKDDSAVEKKVEKLDAEESEVNQEEQQVNQTVKEDKCPDSKLEKEAPKLKKSPVKKKAGEPRKAEKKANQGDSTESEKEENTVVNTERKDKSTLPEMQDRDNIRTKQKSKAEKVSESSKKAGVVAEHELEGSPERQRKTGWKPRARKTAVSGPVRSSPRKGSARLSIIDRLREEKLLNYTSSDTEGYSESGPMATTGKKRGRPKATVVAIESDGDVASDGTEDYWSEDEEILKVDDRVRGAFEQDFDKKKSKKWTLVCNSLDDWKCLARKFKDSEVKCEKQLYSCIMQDFLSELPKLYSYKDEQIMGRARELAKLKEKIRKQSLGEGDTESSSEDERERRSEEAKREQFFKWQKEEEERELVRERERLKKDRAKRARNRELRAEGRTDVESEIEESTEEEEVEETDRKLRTRQHRNVSRLIESRSLDEGTTAALTKVLRCVQEHEDSWIFADQVEEKYAPGYYDVIEEAMWLGRIEEKLEAGLYQAVEEFEADFQLMWDNCGEYNGSDSEYTEASRTLDKVFKRSTKKHLPRYRSASREEKTKPSLPMRASSKRSHSETESATGRARRNASSQAREAMKYAEMSSDEFDEQEDRSLLSGGGDDEETTQGDSGATTGKKRKRDTPDRLASKSTGDKNNKAGLRVAPAPEKCGEGAPLDIVQIQKVDRDHLTAGPGYPHSGTPASMGSSGQMMAGLPAQQWPPGPPGVRPHMGTHGQGCYPPGNNYPGNNGGYPAAAEQPGMEVMPGGGDMMWPHNSQHIRMGGMMAAHRGMGRYPQQQQQQMSSPSQYQGQYGMMPGAHYPGQQRPQMGSMPPPPGYGYNRQINPMMQQSMSPQNSVQRPPGVHAPPHAGSDVATLGSPTTVSDPIQSPKSVDSSAALRSSKVCSPNFGQGTGSSPGLPRSESETRTASPCLSSPRSDTPSSSATHGMRLPSPGMMPPHKPTGSPQQHNMAPPTMQHHMPGYGTSVRHNAVPPHMMDYTHRPGSPMMRPGHMGERFPNPAGTFPHQPAGYPGGGNQMRYPGPPQMNAVYEQGSRPMSGSPQQRLPGQGPRGPAGYPGNQPPPQPPTRETMTQPGSFTSMLQDLEDDMPPPPPPMAGAGMEGFSGMTGKPCPPGMQMDSSGAPMGQVMSPGGLRYGEVTPQRPSVASPNLAAGNQAGYQSTRGNAIPGNAPYPQHSVPSTQVPPQHINTSADKSNSPVTSSSNQQRTAMSEQISDSGNQILKDEKAETDKTMVKEYDKSDAVSNKVTTSIAGGASSSFTNSSIEQKSTNIQSDRLTFTPKEQSADSSGKMEAKVNDGDNKSKVSEGSSLMADLLSSDPKATKNEQAKQLPSPPSSVSRTQASQQGSLPITTVTQSHHLGSAMMSAMSSTGPVYPYRHPHPAEMGQRPPWGPYGPRPMHGNMHMPSQMSPTSIPQRPPSNVIGNNQDATEAGPPSMISPGQRGFGEGHDLAEGGQPSIISPGQRSFGDIPGGMRMGPSGPVGFGNVAFNAASSESRPVFSQINQTGVSSNVPTMTTSSLSQNCTPSFTSMSSVSGGHPAQWNAHPGSVPQANLASGNIPQRNYPVGNMNNASSESMLPNQGVKPGNHQIPPDHQGAMPPHPIQAQHGQMTGGPPSGQTGFPYHNPGMHVQHGQRLFSPGPHGQFSPSSDISGHSNTMSGDLGRGEEMDEEEVRGKNKKGKGKGKGKPAAKKKAAKKDALDQCFQEPPEKKPKTKKTKKKKNEQIEESSNDSDMYMSMSGQKPPQSFLQQPPPFGNQGHPFMGGPNQNPNPKFPYGQHNHAMAYNMPPRPRQPNPSGSLAGMMNMVNQMPVPEQEPVGGMRPDSQQGVFMGENMMPGASMPMGMYPGGEAMNPAYAQMSQGQFQDTQDYLRRFQQPQQPMRMPGSQTITKPDMFMEQSQRQMNSNPTQEVPIVPSVPPSVNTSSPGVPTLPNSSQSAMFSANQTQRVTTTPITASGSSPVSFSTVSQSQPNVSVNSPAVCSVSSESQPGLHSTAHMCSKSSDQPAISSSSESHKLEHTEMPTNTQTGENTERNNSKPSPEKLDTVSNVLKSKEKNTTKELLSSDTNPSLMLTPPESPKSAGCSTNMQSSKVTETQEKPDIQSAGPTLCEQTGIQDSKLTLNRVPQKDANQTLNVTKDMKSDNNTFSDNTRKSPVSVQDALVNSHRKPPSSDMQTPQTHTEVSAPQIDRSSRASVDSMSSHAPDIHGSQRPSGGFPPRPSMDTMKMMPSSMGHPSMQSPGYMGQYYSGQQSQGMMGAEIARHPGYMMQQHQMQQQQHYQQQQNPGMMAMHSRMSLSHQQMMQQHPGMQQSHMMYSYMQSGGGGQMPSHMMSGHMMQPHGSSSAPAPPNNNTSSPGPQYQQL